MIAATKLKHEKIRKQKAMYELKSELEEQIATWNISNEMKELQFNLCVALVEKGMELVLGGEA